MSGALKHRKGTELNLPTPLLYGVVIVVTLAWSVGFVFSVLTTYEMDPQLHQLFITMVTGVAISLGIVNKKGEDDK